MIDVQLCGKAVAKKAADWATARKVAVSGLTWYIGGLAVGRRGRRFGTCLYATMISPRFDFFRSTRQTSYAMFGTRYPRNFFSRSRNSPQPSEARWRCVGFKSVSLVRDGKEAPKLWPDVAEATASIG
jgi:hypothetical protein